MKYLLRPEGNHSNRLFQLAHIVAYCEEYHQPLEILCFDDMAPLYQDGYYCIPPKHNIKSAVMTFLDKVQHKTKIGFLPIINFSDEDAIRQHPLESLPKNCIIDGWYFRCNDLTKKYRQFLREKYVLKDQYYTSNNLYTNIANLDAKQYLKVGVHIKRGDYKDFLDGRYYYENEVFASYMKQFEKQADSLGKRVKFFLFSNEPINQIFTEQFDSVISENPWYIDQFLMTQMDYLIGPPSTFTGWASYINEVPVFFMETANDELTFDKFRIIDG